MARISASEMEQYNESNNSSEWLSLRDDGDVARIQFLSNTPEELDVFVAHKVKVNDKDRWCDCKREYDDPVDMCPLCAAGIDRKATMILSMYDHNDGKIKIWERGPAFKKKLDALFNRYPNLSDMVFEIERRGKKGDQKTTYEIFPMSEVEAVDVSEMERPEFLGGLILDKTADEMQTYLDTGNFPQTDSDNSTPSRRGSSEEVVSRRASSTPSRRGGRF